MHVGYADCSIKGNRLIDIVRVKTAPRSGGTCQLALAFYSNLSKARTGAMSRTQV
jgi:hypothetical protein